MAIVGKSIWQNFHLAEFTHIAPTDKAGTSSRKRGCVRTKEIRAKWPKYKAPKYFANLIKINPSFIRRLHKWLHSLSDYYSKVLNRILSCRICSKQIRISNHRFGTTRTVRIG